MKVERRRRSDVSVAIAAAVAGACGRDARYADLARDLLIRIGNALLSQIQQDFLVKSRRGIGRDGIEWPELKPETIRRRRVSPQDERDVRKAIKELRGRIYADELGRLRAATFSSFAPRPITMQDEKIDAVLVKRARKYAKELVEAAAKRLRNQLLSTRQVDILRDTGAMFRAFTPGVGLQVPTNPGQSFETNIGSARVTVGNAEKPWHQEGNDRLPARSSWPIDGTIPEAWWPPIILAAERGMRHLLTKALERPKL